MTSAVDAISTPLLIAGEERPGGAGTFPVYDPAQTGGIIGYAAAASRDDALAAVAAAEAAWPAWSAMTSTERVGIVLKALEALETDQDARTDILSRENGKIRFEAFIGATASTPG
jgi:acyl-CoA reductase-like NAD-dependent aldehyde dehydrogenase